MSGKRFRIAVLISGGGTTLKNLIDKVAAKVLDVEIGLVVSSSPAAGGLDYAKEASIESVVVPKPKGLQAEEYRQAIFQPIRDAEIDLVVMGGFLKHVLIPADYENRVINIHPSLIPAFCGQGFYGLKVHQAVIDQGCKVTGCTVHFVDNQYDHGPIIAQVPVAVNDDDSAETLQQRVFAAECQIYPKVIAELAQKPNHNL